MRRPAKIFALVLALTTAPLTAALTAAGPAAAATVASSDETHTNAVTPASNETHTNAVSPATNETHTNAVSPATNETHTNAGRALVRGNEVRPNAGQWVFITDLPDELWICYYEGNQLVESGKYVSYSCEAGPPGQLALWALTA